MDGKKNVSTGVGCLIILAVIALVVIVFNVVGGSDGPAPQPQPCPTESATGLIDAFEEGFERGLSGCVEQ